MNKKVVIKIISIVFLSIFAILIGMIFTNRNYISKVNIKEYSEDNVSIDVEVDSLIPFISGKKYCILTKSDKKPSVNDKSWVLAENGICHLSVGKDYSYLYIKDIWGNIDNLDINKKPVKKLFDVGYKYDYYLYTGMTLDLEEIRDNYYAINSDYTFEIEGNSVEIDGDIIKAIGKGKSSVYLKGFDDSSEVVINVTDAIGEPVLEENKPLITCEQFSNGEADFIDDVLAMRVKEAGEGTRAAVIAVARFITLEFKYKVPYFYENGRLQNYDPYLHVDGEGRYYHKGLYLNKSKFNDIEASLVGPAIWGCDLQNFTDWGPYISGKSYPNGLDCSGFVSWALYNAGLNMGDIGAGVDNNHDDFTDLGELVYLSDELMSSGRVKVGDLIGLNGHIAIIAGMDENNIYIAESLNTTGGVVITTVSLINLVHNSIYQYVVLMDNYYKNNDNYTNMW